jgi:hypothetical protein
MISFFQKYARNNDKSPPYKMSDNVDELFEDIVNRKHWKNINPNIIRAILKKTNGDPEKVEQVKLMVYISELFNIVQDNFLKISETEEEKGNNYLLTLFAITLFKIGDDCHENVSIAASSGNNEIFKEKWNHYGALADMAYMSSILCDEFELSAYHGMAFLYSFKNDGKISLEFCEKYTAAKNKLLNTPDGELNCLQIVTKDFILNPEKEKENIKEMVDRGFYPPECLNKSLLSLQDKDIEKLKRKIILREPEQIKKYLEARRSLAQDLRRDPMPEEIASKMDKDVEEILYLMKISQIIN